jgi:cyclopropane-fatty-acyl-phospholipid synthase
MLERLLRDKIKVGRLTLREGRLPPRSFGTCSADCPELDVEVSVRNGRTAALIAFDPELRFGQAYMDGDLRIERGTIWSLFELLGRNLGEWRPKSSAAVRVLRRASEWFSDGNSPRKASANARHHYDLDEALYRRFLDSDMQYSCAYFPHPGMSLEEAQAVKKAHIIAKLAIEPGCRVLDIGSGWGGLAISIAKLNPGVEVMGITLSPEQLKRAETRAREAGVSDRVHFRLRDYRRVTERYDRVVSVGMFEHVGKAHFDKFYAKLAELLHDDGLALVHSIGRRSRGGGSNPWLERYIFPGGYVPSISEASAAIERSNLWITDIEVWRLHYAETLRCWNERFQADRAAIEAHFDARFCRMWEFYLASCAMAFRYGDLMVFQTQLAKQVATLPVARDYMMSATGALLETPPNRQNGIPGNVNVARQPVHNSAEA